MPRTTHVNGDPSDLRRKLVMRNARGRRSRWAKSEITFGPLGRIVATVLAVGLAWGLWWGLGIIGILLGLGYVRDALPQALRDIWRPVRLPPTEQDLIRARAEDMRLDELPPTPPESPIASRPTPSRW